MSRAKLCDLLTARAFEASTDARQSAAPFWFCSLPHFEWTTEHLELDRSAIQPDLP
jgi:hypothetical protein